jgi:tRNA A-37 threonylcarbamoyl transferase component Bud32
MASGRDADIFEYGTNQVLRRSRNARSMDLEARTMEFVRAKGYPVPRVDEVSPDGSELIMERINGANMVDALNSTPWKANHFGVQLAKLHVQLHELVAPEWLPPAPCGVGSQLLHMDLHPLNVMVTAQGPMVIDWCNAVRGDSNTDVAVTWTLLSAGEVPTRGLKGKLVGVIRSRLIHGFIGSFDRNAIRPEVEAIVTWKSRDTNMSMSEIASMRNFARRVR